MNKEFLKQDIQSLEDQIIIAQDERDRLKGLLHEIECDEENQRIQELRETFERDGFSDQPLLPKDWNTKQFEETCSYLDKVAKAYNLKRCIYSCHDKNLGDIAFHGDCLLVHEGWDDEEYNEAHRNPTWFDVWVFADKAIRMVDDGCHVFLEGLYKGKFENIMHLSMGS